jgi:hypothetical protein
MRRSVFQTALLAISFCLITSPVTAQDHAKGQVKKADNKPSTVELPPIPPDAPPPTPATTGSETATGSERPAGVPANSRFLLFPKIAKVCDACRTQDCDQAVKTTCDQAIALQRTFAERDSKGERVDDCSNPTSSCYHSFWLRNGVDVESVARADVAEAEDLRHSLGMSQDTAGGPELLLTTIGGLQSFLAERAKTEAIKYSVEQFKERLCKENDYLENSCKLLGSPDLDLDLDEATMVRFKQALLSDMAQLPLKLLNIYHPATTDDERAWRVFLDGAIRTTVTVVKDKLPPVQFPGKWAEANRAGIVKAGLEPSCSINGENPMPSSCWGLLLPELGAAAAQVVHGGEKPDPVEVAEIIESAAQEYCKAYGPKEEKEHGRCILGAPDKYEGLKRSFETLAEASVQFAKLQKTANDLAEHGASSSEVAQRLLPNLADVLMAWNDAIQGLEVPTSETVGTALSRTAVVLRCTAAAVERDYTAVIAYLSEAFEEGQPFAGAHLPPKLTHSLGFAARLAAAKGPEDAKKVFEEEAEPLGTYKIKYDRGRTTIAVNAFVGSFVGYGWRLKTQSSTDAGSLAARPLSAPLGIDFSFPSGKYAHFGLLIELIDPFAIGTVDSNSKAEEFDWGAVLTPGLFVRLGVGGSPFTILAGGTWQPLAESSDSCARSDGSSVPCWKGALQLGGAVAVDIPILILR